MIVDDMTHLKDYVRILPALEPVVGFLESHDLQALPEGSLEWGADGCRVNLQTLPPKAPTQAVLESHVKTIDIQIPLTGDETMGYSPLKGLRPAPYDESGDISFHEERPGSFVTVKKGMFAIFFPRDAHAPGITAEPLGKAVFKVPASDDRDRQEK